MKISETFEYRTSFFLTLFLASGINFLIRYLLWKEIFEYSAVSEINGYSFNEMVLYYIFSTFIYLIVDSNRVGIEIGNGIRLGELSKFLVYPITFFEYNFFTFLGKKIIQASTSLFALAVIFFAFPQLGEQFQFSIQLVLMLCLIVALGIILNFLMDLFLSNFAFWIDEIWTVVVIKMFITQLLSGMVLPLDFFPKYTVEIFRFLPFQYVLYFPVKLWLGQVPFAEFLFGVKVCAVWLFLLMLMNFLFWRKGLKLYSGIGM